MNDIYQQIWNADQQGNGVTALLSDNNNQPETGYVKVNTDLDEFNKDIKVLTEVNIPNSKIKTYDLCRKLFNNYALPERDIESTTNQEKQEVNDLIQSMLDTPPMIVAKEYIEVATGISISRESWFNTIMEHWFRSFSAGGDPDLTGFEHIIVGEQEGGKAQGYHFWYKYYLDDGFANKVDGIENNFSGLIDDRISYLGSKLKTGQDIFPESVTISYRWFAPDYDREKMRPLTKKIGGFFVGCSIEGLLALGTVRAYLGAGAPKIAVINGAKYELKVFRSKNNRHIRTFYPLFLGPDNNPKNTDPIINPNPIDTDLRSDDSSTTSNPIETISSSIRIIAALVNPEGRDENKETVTLINTGDSNVSLKNWDIIDKNGKTATLSDLTLSHGDTVRILLDRREAQLSNKGGSITLKNSEGSIVHAVSYSKTQAKSSSGLTLLF